MKKTSKISRKFKLSDGDKAGLYLTIIVHLVVIIILLAYSIHLQVAKETSFVLDFTKQEELEKAIKEQEMIESVNQELDALINAAKRDVPRNAVVNVSNKSKTLKDDRFENPDEIYDEARKLQEKLDQNKREMDEASDDDENIAIASENSKKKKKKENYTGPSVISYSLDGRKAMSLPIPAYKCMGGGDVSVCIIVNRKGYVMGTKIVEPASSKDHCLREYALKAAGRSRFQASSTAPERQVGEIVYRFVEQ